MKEIYMFKNFKIRGGLLLIGLTVILLVAGISVSLAAGSSQVSKDIQAKIGSLLNQLNLAAEKELISGNIIETGQGRFFAGESAEKTERLHQQTQKQIDDLIARPAIERGAAIAKIRSFANSPDLIVEYKYTSKSSYNWEVPAEIYYVGDNMYEIDIRNNEIIQFGPRPLTAVDLKPKEELNSELLFSVAELERMARQVIAHNTRVELAKLSAAHGNKEEVNYFFRWEDHSRRIEGLYPFIQAGLSKSGVLVSYTNSLGL